MCYNVCTVTCALEKISLDLTVVSFRVTVTLISLTLMLLRWRGGRRRSLMWAGRGEGRVGMGLPEPRRASSGWGCLSITPRDCDDRVARHTGSRFVGLGGVLLCYLLSY